MKVAVYFAEGYEEIEALAVVDVLRRAKLQVIMTGVTGISVKSGRNITIQMDTTIENLDHHDIDMIVLPGGIPGVYNLEKNKHVFQNIKEFKKQGKWLAAICAAPSILGKAGLLRGEKATCYPSNEIYLEGCQYIDEATVISNKIVTSKGVGTAIEFALVLLEIIKGKEVSNQIKKDILFKEN